MDSIAYDRSRKQGQTAPSAQERFTRRNSCPICGGYPSLPRGKGIRCAGFTTDSNIYCIREQYAGNLPLDESTIPASYRHWRYGKCPCGIEHNPARSESHQPVKRINGQQPRHKSIPYKLEAAYEQLTTETGKPFRLKGQPGLKPIAAYNYRNAEGWTIYKVIRYTPKDFRPWIWDGSEWVCTLPDEARMLWMLPELLANSQTPVFIVEGEKACKALVERGLLATCASGGASAAWHDSFTAFFAGRQVIYLRDNDAAGRSHQNKVVPAVAQVAASIKVVTLPGLPDKGDVYDFFAVGGTKDALLRLVEQAEEWTPGEDGEGEATPDEPEPAEEVRRPLSLRELLARPKPEMLIAGLLRCQRNSMVYGDSNSAKTWVADDIGLSVATGHDWHGRKVRQGPVLYVAAEDVEGVAERSQHWLTYHHQDIDTVPFKVWEWPVELTSKDDTDAFIAAVQASTLAPVLVIIDTFADCFTGDEISNQHMGAAMRNLERIQQALNAHVLTVHHTNKAQTAYRGHSSMRAKMDTILECSLNDTHLLTLRQDKQKGIRKGDDITLKLKVLSLSADPDATTCILVTPDPGEVKRQQDSQRMEILRLIAGYGEQGASGGQVQKDGVALPGKRSKKTVQRTYVALAEAGDVLMENVGSEDRPRYHLTITEQGRAKVGGNPPPDPGPEPGNSSDIPSDMTGHSDKLSSQTREANHRTERTNTRDSVCPSDEVVWSEEKKGEQVKVITERVSDAQVGMTEDEFVEAMSSPKLKAGQPSPEMINHTATRVIDHVHVAPRYNKAWDDLHARERMRLMAYALHCPVISFNGQQIGGDRETWEKFADPTRTGIDIILTVNRELRSRFQG